MNRYDILVRILDCIRAEGSEAGFRKKYPVDNADFDEINSGRSRAFIHLYLKVMFGLFDFSEREHYVTDGSNDGGIDGYFIDKSWKRVYILQSKFRATAKNFEEKAISTDELLSMDIDRIIGGHDKNEKGEAYNGKIAQFARELRETQDIARYNYEVVIIANCFLNKEQVRRLTGGYNAEIFDYTKSYTDLVFPIISGTFFKAEDLVMQLDLSNKSAGARTSYQVLVNAFECEITVLFAPTLEIARVMDRYKNSVLEYNPRSYLDLDGGAVNKAIRNTLMQPDSNEFALLNNGITILSDQTDINERVGKKNTAQLRMVNPQIINGGQTAYTLSRVFRENDNASGALLDGKEVLVKVITLTPKDVDADNSAERLALIDEISLATNRQTAVIEADRYSNDHIHKKFQEYLFNHSGLLYERKRGEFSEGINSGYIRRDEIIERNLLIRIVYAIDGQIDKAAQKKVFVRSDLSAFDISNSDFSRRILLGYNLFRALQPAAAKTRRYRDTLAKIFIGASLYEQCDADVVDKINSDWRILMDRVKATRPQFIKKTKTGANYFAVENWLMSGFVSKDAKAYVKDCLDNKL